jgi:hypothetical protein
MSDVDEHGRPDPPVDGDELAILRGFLDFHRATFAGKVDGLDADALNRTVGASTMTLGGMMKHGTGTRPPSTVPRSCGRRGVARSRRPDPRVDRRADRRVTGPCPDGRRKVRA